MNNQISTNRPGRTFQVVGLAAASLFLTYCLGVGHGMQEQQAVQAANEQPKVQQVEQPTLHRADQADAVYFVCEWSRQQVDGPSERLCGSLQDAYQMEYLCKERSASPDNQCWIESTDGDTPESLDV